MLVPDPAAPITAVGERLEHELVCVLQHVRALLLRQVATADHDREHSACESLPQRAPHDALLDSLDDVRAAHVEHANG